MSSPMTSGTSPELLYRAARMYYLEGATQAEVALALGTSRPTVSRLLSEARESGIVTIEVHEPNTPATRELEESLASHLGLRRAYVRPPARDLGTTLGPGAAEALQAADLRAGDALLVSSGASIHAVAQQPLPTMPGVLLAPTVGGVDEPEAYYQTNEITRTIAVAVQGRPVLLYAPAMPSASLRRELFKDEGIQRVNTLWHGAKAALLGIGAPPRTRSSVPSFLPRDLPALGEAIGDTCARPYDRSGRPVVFPGMERLVAMELDDLRRVPHTIALAVGAVKVPAIRAAVAAGYVNTLVTDTETARLLLADRNAGGS